MSDGVRGVVVIRIAAALSLPAAALHAQQEPAASMRHLTFALGPGLISQREPSASLLRYTGLGALAQIEYTARADGGWFTVRMSGALGSLRSELTGPGTLPRQEVWRGWLDVEHTRRVTRNGARIRAYLGGVLTTHGTITRHSYSDSSQTGAALFGVSVGPVATLERSLGSRGTLSAGLAVPVISVIGRPYGNVYRSPGVRTPLNLSWQVATPTTYRAADLTTTYAMRLSNDKAVVIRHHVAIEYYRGAQTLRFAAQWLGLALDVPVGGAGRR